MTMTNMVARDLRLKFLCFFESVTHAKFPQMATSPSAPRLGRRPLGHCRCHPRGDPALSRQISGPLLERTDLHVEVPRLPPGELRPDTPPGELSDDVRARVIRAREVQQHRAGRCNAHLDQSGTNAACRLAPEDQAMLENVIDILGPHVAAVIGYQRSERVVPSPAL